MFLAFHFFLSYLSIFISITDMIMAQNKKVICGYHYPDDQPMIPSDKKNKVIYHNGREITVIVPMVKSTSETLIQSYKRDLTLKKTMARFRKGGRRYIPHSLHQDIPTNCYIVDCRDGVGVDVQVSIFHRTEHDGKVGTTTSSMIHIRDAREEGLMIKNCHVLVAK